jgi:hypothetical protein
LLYPKFSHADKSIAEGYWQLLQQRSYTDNMAVACARIWKIPDYAVPTDPLRPESLLRRLYSSVWFLRKVWDAEMSLSFYPTDAEIRRNCGEYEEWSSFRKNLMLPSVTKFVASAYFDKVDKKIPSYPVPREVLSRDQDSWENTRNKLEQIVKESCKEDALHSRRKQ